MVINILRIPMYGLYYIGSNQEDFKLDNNFLTRLKADYNEEEINKIFECLEWAIQNPNYNFGSLLPNLPVGNEEIFKYLSRWYECLKLNKDFLGIR